MQISAGTRQLCKQLRLSIRLFGCFCQGVWLERFVLLLVDDDVMFAPPLITRVV